MAAKLKKGDKVVVLAGKDKGKKGEITRVMPKDGKAIVDGVNIAIRHTRQSANRRGAVFHRRCPSTCRTSRLLTRTARRPALASASKATRRCALPRPRGT
jgi:large subunit ribosomal protein L24